MITADGSNCFQTATKSHFQGRCVSSFPFRRFQAQVNSPQEFVQDEHLVLDRAPQGHFQHAVLLTSCVRGLQPDSADTRAQTQKQRLGTGLSNGLLPWPCQLMRSTASLRPWSAGRKPRAGHLMVATLHPQLQVWNPEN